MTDTDDANNPPVIALIAAVRDELAPTIHRLHLQPGGDVYRGEVGTRSVIAAATGVGPQRMTRMVEHLIGTYEPARLILLGFCGGLDPSLSPGHVIDARWLVDTNGEGVRLNASAPPSLSEHADSDMSRTLLTAGHLVRLPAEKAALFAAHHAAAVDMESLPVARLAAGRQTRLSVIRAICDPADMTLPAGIETWVNEDGTANAAAATRAMLTRPWSAPTILRLRKFARLAAKRLADEMEAELFKD